MFILAIGAVDFALFSRVKEQASRPPHLTIDRRGPPTAAIAREFETGERFQAVGDPSVNVIFFGFSAFVLTEVPIRAASLAVVVFDPVHALTVKTRAGAERRGGF